MNTALIQEHISLADKNWFKTGGAARFYAEPTTAYEFQEAIAWAHSHDMPIFLLGSGANILISDEGFAGLVIRPRLLEKKVVFHDNNTGLVQAGAGVSIEDLITFCLDNNLSGLEEFSGIPGTVGGAVYINLHYFEFLLSQFLISAQVIEKKTGILLTVDNTWFEFGYNQSTLLQENHYLATATFNLKKINDAAVSYARGRHHEIIRHRAKKYPTTNTCGSFFRNFHPEEVAHEKSGKSLIYVAYYLDKVGIKGALQVGGARVSHQHANMLVTAPGATSTDVIHLARTMQEMVSKEFGITPQPECRLIGFKKYPLL
jgi:UDP-N-acetylmuramate dehydrogenase